MGEDKSMMKRKICSLSIGLIFLLTACGSSANDRLNEYLDLGQKYIAGSNQDASTETAPAATKAAAPAAIMAAPAETKTAAPAATIAPAASMAAPTEASIKAEGWVQTNGKWYFYAGGEKAVGWMQQGENYFYFDEKGVLQHGKTKIGSDEYFFNEDGAMVTGWREEGGKWYYFGPDGKMLADQWVEDTYYTGPDGAMLVSTTTPDGQEVDAEGKIIRPVTYADVYIDLLGRKNEEYWNQGRELRFALVYVDNDDIPELIISTKRQSGDNPSLEAEMYTFRNGDVKFLHDIGYRFSYGGFGIIPRQNKCLENYSVAGGYAESTTVLSINASGDLAAEKEISMEADRDAVDGFRYYINGQETSEHNYNNELDAVYQLSEAYGIVSPEDIVYDKGFAFTQENADCIWAAPERVMLR